MFSFPISPIIFKLTKLTNLRPLPHHKWTHIYVITKLFNTAIGYRLQAIDRGSRLFLTFTIGFPRLCFLYRLLPLCQYNRLSFVFIGGLPILESNNGHYLPGPTRASCLQREYDRYHNRSGLAWRCPISHSFTR